MNGFYPKILPSWLGNLFPGVKYAINTSEDEIYLTFDDGPHPEITPWILEQLKAYHSKATFFCLGENVEKYPEIFKEITDQKHAVGNHSFSHMNGWKTEKNIYIEDIKRADKIIKSNLLRPPYGKMKPSQYSILHTQYKIVLWSVMPGDFDMNNRVEDCFKTIRKNTRPGNIIVLHDNEKSFPILKELLPRALDWFTENNYTLKSLSYVD